MPDGVKSARSRTFPPLTGRRKTVVSTFYVPNSAFNTIETTQDVAYSHFPGTQYTESIGHQWPPSKAAKGDNVGGEFFTQKKYVASGGDNVAFSTKRVQQEGPNVVTYVASYSGILLPGSFVATSASFPPPDTSSSSKIDQLGATAIARCEPTNSPADAATFLGELLKDGIPSLIGAKTWKDRTLSARNAGDEYLNAQFGWRPLVHDIRSFADVMRHSHTKLAQYERDAGKTVRRRYRFSSSSSSDEVVVATNDRTYGPSYSDHLGTANGTVYRRRETRREQWFSGAFTYHLPSGYDSRNEMVRLAREAQHLFGLSLTPDVLWNIAPWSWAVDWFSNTGDVIHNISRFANQGLVMRYGYMMEHTRVSDTYRISPSGLKPGCPDPAPITFVTETKTRRAASPFGFGVSLDALSAFQLSIMAALGLSKGGR